MDSKVIIKPCKITGNVNGERAGKLMPDTTYRIINYQSCKKGIFSFYRLQLL